MNKQHILAEIRRTAESNGGVPLGIGRFFEQTGIKEADWKGKLWARWGDAVREAGYEPNKLQQAFGEEHLLDQYALLAAELGRLPVTSEMRLRKRANPDFPNEKVFSERFGNKQEFVRRLASHCDGRDDLGSVAALCREFLAIEDGRQPAKDAVEGRVDFGFVYPLKSGRFYKIGRSNSAGRRERELAIQLPEQASMVHVMRTDDPCGIEAYWHKRFDSKRRNGEWFELNAADIGAFERRKFM